MKSDPPWQFTYHPGTIHGGCGVVANLESALEPAGLSRALVICGQSVGANRPLMRQITAGLGDSLVDIFDETTPAKRLSTAAAALDIVNTYDVDVLVGVGGGSSLDVTKQVALLAASESSAAELASILADTHRLPVPDEELLPIVAIPTTLAGADLAHGAGVSAELPSGAVVTGGFGDPRLFPAHVVMDPALIATTPPAILRGSAMNGFNKGVETLYAASATPITDATAMWGLALLSDSLPILADPPFTGDDIAAIAAGMILVQYGIARPNSGTLSIIHAVGHGLRRTSDIQQGVAHAIMTPHVLSLLFAEVDGRRSLLAKALGVAGEPDHAQASIERIVSLRDELDLPSTLREIDDVERADFPRIIEIILDDPLLANGPPGLELTRDSLEEMLAAAW